MVHIPPLWKQRGTTFQMTVFSCSVVHITQPSSLLDVIISYSPVNTCQLHTLCHCHNKMVQCVCSEGCGHLWSVFITYDGNKSTTYIIRSAPCSSHIHNYTHTHMHTHTHTQCSFLFTHTGTHIHTHTLSLIYLPYIVFCCRFTWIISFLMLKLLPSTSTSFSLTIR